MDLDFDLSGIGLRLRLPEALGVRFAEDWSRYSAGAGSGEPLVDIDVRVGGAPVPEGPIVGELATVLGGAVTRFAMPEGELELGEDGSAAARLGPAPLDKQFYVLVTLAAAALGRRGPVRGVLLVHAAGVVLDGRGFLLVGPSGCGKTTFAAQAKKAGALFLSDDQVFVDTRARRPVLLSAPVRGDKPEPVGPGRFPLALVLVAGRGAGPRLETVSRLQVSATLAANLPYIAPLLGRDPEVDRALHDLVERAPSRRLVFAPEPSFVELLRSFPG